MKLHDLHNTKGAVRSRRRIGRGDASGYGRTCGRGEKGQKSRTGSVIRPFFEGGQIPLFRRLPKRGFTSRNHKEYDLVNVSILEKLFDAGAVVDAEILRGKGVLGKTKLPLKVLGSGDIAKALTVKANKFSASAREKIEASGGTCEVL
ncbi:MAG: 50S ribosomal protein L15 [Kiritimatiellaeota bacterium]|nr:50S ribosomal protein L15 [Kiritimatiellota bacterium]